MSGLRRAFVALLFLGLGANASAGTVRTLLQQDGRDVSASVEGRIVFTPLPGTEGAPIECAPAAPCDIPEGRYTIGIRSTTHVSLERPEYGSDSPPGGFPEPFSLDVAPAASLRLGPGRFTAGDMLTVLDVESGLPFKRAIAANGVTLRVPARKVVAAVFRGAADIVELWRPLAPRAGEQIDLPDGPRLVKGRGQLAVSLLFPPSGADGANRTVSVLWKTESRAYPPDLVVTGDWWRWTGFWFDVPHDEGTVEIESRDWVLEAPEKVTVPDRGIAFPRDRKVIRRPSLKARFEENERLPPGRAEVELLDCRRLTGQTGPPSYSLCSRVSTLEAAVGEEFLFEGLDPVLYGLRWQAGAFRDIHLVSLRNGLTKEVTIPVVIHRVTGRVTRRGRPVPEGRITWRHLPTGLEPSTPVDENGRFEALLAPTGQFFAAVDGPGFQRHMEIVHVDRDCEVDFVVPTNTTEATVLEAQSGEPIPGAFVNWYFQEVGDGSLGRAERLVCDAQGRATLPPFPPGALTVLARAPGFRKSEERRLEITKESASAELEFRLEKGVETRIRIVDANGNPAVGARAQLPSGEMPEPELTNDAGEAVFESLVRPGDVVFAASAAGAIVLARYSGEGTAIRIPPPSRAFTVRFVAGDGRPAHQKHLSYAIDGVEVPFWIGYQSRIAAGGVGVSRRDGTLVVAGLPSSGTVTLWPDGVPSAAITRPLPVTETLELRVP